MATCVQIKTKNKSINKYYQIKYRIKYLFSAYPENSEYPISDIQKDMDIQKLYMTVQLYCNVQYQYMFQDICHQIRIFKLHV